MRAGVPATAGSGWHEHVVHPSVAHIMDGPSEDQTLVWKKPGFEIDLTKLPEVRSLTELSKRLSKRRWYSLV